MKKNNLTLIKEKIINANNEMLPAILWDLGNIIYTFNYGEKKLLFKLLMTKINNKEYNPKILFSILQFMNQTAPYMHKKNVDVFIDYFASNLNSLNSRLRIYIYDSIARMNYLASPRTLFRICLKVKENVKSTMDLHEKESVLNFFESIYYYIHPKNKDIVIEICKKIGEDLKHRINKKESLIEKNKTDVLILIPEFLTGKHYLQPPVCALTEISILEKSGIKTSFIDNRINHLSTRKINNYIKNHGIKIVLMITTTYDQVSIYYCDYRYKILENTALKLKKSQAKLVLVGSHGTINGEILMKIVGPMAIIKGEWELSAKNLIEKLKNNNWNENCLANINNIIYKKNGKFIHTSIDQETINPNVVNLPMPNYDKIDFDYYHGDDFEGNTPLHKKKWAVILAQRGCPFKCAFCYRFFGNKIRQRTPEQIVNEMEILEKKYKVSHIFFIDYTFTINKDWVDKLCNYIIDKNLKIEWSCETRADQINPSILQKMKSANCRRIWLGVESFNDEILNKCNKMTENHIITNAINQILNAGIYVSCFLLIGLPGETLKTLQNTIDIFKDETVKFQKSIIMVTPRAGTTLIDKKNSISSLSLWQFERLHKARGLVSNELTSTDLANLSYQLSGI